MRSVTRRSPPEADPYEVLCGPWSLLVATGVLLGATMLVALGKSSGLGIELCWLRRLSGVPCPGCGLTRAVCYLVQMEWLEAIRLNPFSLVLVPWALVVVSSRLWAESWRVGLRRWLGHRRRAFGLLYGGLILAFVVFGSIRALAVVSGLMTWP